MAPKAKNSDRVVIELFLDMQAAERGASKNTLAAYAKDLAEVSAHLGAAGRSIARATTEDLRGYLGTLRKRGFAASSMARRVSALPPLHPFLYAPGTRPHHPSAVIEGPKRGRALPKVLGIAEVDRLLAQARTAMDKPDQPAPERLGAARLLCLIGALS